MKLIEILDKHNLNHETHLIGTDKNSVHNYIQGFYEKEFEKYKDKKINLLEIGISSGASMYMWNKYFPDANLYGIDITNIIRREHFLENINYIFSNAYDLNLINNLPEFDIIIDDGPHTIETQIFVIKFYLNKLKKDGILIIEDVQYVENFEILKNAVPPFLRDKVEAIDLRKDKDRYDDLMFVIRV